MACRAKHPFDFWLNRMVRFLEVGFVVSVAAWMALTVGDQHWPYDVIERRLLTPKIAPGESLMMRRVIDYHEEDCWRQYDRRVVSKAAGGMVFRPAPFIEQRLPVDLSGKPQIWSAALPADFPCGPAYLVETITAGCSWFQRTFHHLQKPDVTTPFEVTCAQ